MVRDLVATHLDTQPRTKHLALTNATSAAMLRIFEQTMAITAEQIEQRLGQHFAADVVRAVVAELLNDRRLVEEALHTEWRADQHSRPPWV